MLAFHKSRLQGFADNRHLAEQRYARRLDSIQEKRDRIADRMQRQHRSFAGRMQALTKKGRARQTDELERLDDRAALLKGQAGRNFAALQERQFQAEQHDRIFRAREIKLFRLNNLELRQNHAKAHQQNRPREIEERSQALKRVDADQALRRELHQLNHGQGRGRTVSR